MLRRWTVAMIALGLSMSGAAAQENLSIPSVAPASLGALLRHEAPAANVTGMLYLPAGAKAPLPAMVLKHGSGGMGGPTGANIVKWAGILTGWGVAALVVDSFGSRGISETATAQGQLSSWADVADALAALKVLGADPRIDPKRIGIMGWSRGGTVAFNTALESVRQSIVTDELKFALHISIYGAAPFQTRDRATDHSPLLFLHGEADNYVPVGQTREFADWLKSMGNAVTFISYPGVYHDFDVEGGYYGIARSLETYGNCDMVVELPAGQVTRLNHQENPAKTGPEDLRAYIRSCIGHGATLAFDGAARADAIEKVHIFLGQNFHLGG